MNHSNTRKLLAGYFLYECGRAMYFVLVTWFLYQWTENALYTGLFVSFGFIPGLISNLIFGVLVDRYNRKRLSIIAGGVSVVVLSALWTAFLCDLTTPWLIIFTHMMLQTSGSLFRPSLQALAAEVYKVEELPRIFSLSGSATISGSLAGAGLGGMFSSFFTMTLSLIIVILLYSGAFLVIWLLDYVPAYQRNNRAQSDFYKEIYSGFTYLHSHKMLYGLFVMMMIGQLTFHTTLGFLSVYTSDFLKQSALVYGALDIMFSIGGIAAGLLGAWWWRHTKNHLAIYALLTMCTGLIILGSIPSTGAALAGILLVGTGTSIVRALLQSVQQIATDRRFHGRMASFRMLCNQTSVVVTGPLFGWVAHTHGANNVFLLLFVPAMFGLLWAWFQSKHPQFVDITSRTA
ncbi:MFS transporter [Halobacillus sp. A5]|uniref:MFS transporter n=1 Tax=Halobacillus sp. A5 TaxID=2880263 RepID=UPI0020A64023|nr:MFS transporter [Halobacillus sp. A5]MCP3029337.1 MFS transporter [Halobacillus sp. A5]